MIFSSDNWAGAHPKIASALATHASGYAPAYGGGDLDRAVERRFSEIFEREVAIFFVATGTAANSLAMAAVARPGGVVFAHREAHVIEDESGAPEYLANGARVKPVEGAAGKVDPAILEAEIAKVSVKFPHGGQPMAVSITQATEGGTVYSLDEIEAIGATGRRHGLPLHMDGARFANALAALGTTPADMTWRRGVDLLSFGGTKNGCWCAEALVFMDPAKVAGFPFIRMRAGHLFSKTRFVAAQFAAYFDGGLWLETAAHANAMAARLAAHIRASRKVRLAWEPQANEVFAVMDEATKGKLQDNGARFYDWPMPPGIEAGADERLFRFVTSFATTTDEVDRFGDLIQE